MNAEPATNTAGPHIFHLVRHAARLPGYADLGLSSEGRIAARCLAFRLASENPTTLHSSPLTRARETATIIAEVTGLGLTCSPQLVERQLVPKMLSSQAFDELWTRSEDDRDFAPTGGESSRSAGRRLAEYLIGIAASEDEARAIIVTHGGIIRDLLRELSDYPLAGNEADMWAQSPIPMASVTSLTLSRGGQWRARQIGSVSTDFGAT